MTQKMGMGSPEYLKLSLWQEMVKKHMDGTRKKLGEKLTGKYEEEGQRMSLEEVINYAVKKSPKVKVYTSN